MIGCTAVSGLRQYLDRTTAATILVGATTVFAHERPEVAANLRDYVDVTPIDVNRGGKRTLYLYCNVWSTIDRINEHRLLVAESKIGVVADGRMISMNSGKTLLEAGIGESPVPDPARSLRMALGEVSVEALRSIARANDIYVRVESGTSVDVYRLWRDRRAQLNTFIAAVPGH